MVFWSLIAIAILLIVAIIVTKLKYSDVAIEGDVLIFKSDVKEKRFVIEEIEKIEIEITTTSSFCVDIAVASFYNIRFTRENLAVLKELILLCKKSNVTAEELDTLVKKSCWSLL